jgi:hypothetical protein
MLEVGRESLKSLESVRGEEVRQLLARESIPLTSFLSGTPSTLFNSREDQIGNFLIFIILCTFFTTASFASPRIPLCLMMLGSNNCESLVVRRSNHPVRSGSHPHLILLLSCVVDPEGFWFLMVSNIWIRIRVRIQIQNEPMRIHNTGLYKLLSQKGRIRPERLIRIRSRI